MGLSFGTWLQSTAEGWSSRIRVRGCRSCSLGAKAPQCQQGRRNDGSPSQTPHCQSLATRKGAEEAPSLVVAPDSTKASALGSHIGAGWARGRVGSKQTNKNKVAFLSPNNKFNLAPPIPFLCLLSPSSKPVFRRALPIATEPNTVPGAPLWGWTPQPTQTYPVLLWPLGVGHFGDLWPSLVKLQSSSSLWCPRQQCHLERPVLLYHS